MHTRELLGGLYFCNILLSSNGKIRNVQNRYPSICYRAYRYALHIFPASGTHTGIDLPPSPSTSTPHVPTLNTIPSPRPSQAPAPTFQHSNRARWTTSHRCPLSASACSTLISGANFSTSTLLTANLVTLISLGQDAGSAGRNATGRTEGEVRMVLQDSNVERFLISVVSALDAAASGLLLLLLVEAEEVECAARKDHVNASTSSRIREWMRRCMLLCRVSSNRYDGRDCRVEINDSQDEGRKTCT